MRYMSSPLLMFSWTFFLCIYWICIYCTLPFCPFATCFVLHRSCTRKFRFYKIKTKEEGMVPIAAAQSSPQIIACTLSFFSPGTNAGNNRSSVSPNPNSPCSFEPHAHTLVANLGEGGWWQKISYCLNQSNKPTNFIFGGETECEHCAALYWRCPRPIQRFNRTWCWLVVSMP